jgi:hypothetical protein
MAMANDGLPRTGSGHLGWLRQTLTIHAQASLRRRVVEYEAQESMSDRPFGKVRKVEIERNQSPKFSGTRYWVIAAAMYALAKLLEFLDERIYSLGSIVSGHTLKHLAAAAASLAILRLLQTRRSIAP